MNTLFELILVDPNTTLCHEWHQKFEKYPEFTIVNDYFENLPAFDCMVSPANSFGIMDGGVDYAITRFFGEQLQASVQKMILLKTWQNSKWSTNSLF
jgi:hypothetical protein